MNINNKTATRRTRQREALWRVFAEAERPLTPDEARARAGDGVGIATVYRAVRRWADEGRLASVSLPGEPARYERADLAHHHHFCCDRCGRVFDLKGCPLGVGRLLPRGFRALTHQITFHGWCRECGAGLKTGAITKRRTANPRRSSDRRVNP